MNDKKKTPAIHIVLSFSGIYQFNIPWAERLADYADYPTNFINRRINYTDQCITSPFDFLFRISYRDFELQIGKKYIVKCRTKSAIDLGSMRKSYRIKYRFLESEWMLYWNTPTTFQFQRQKIDKISSL